LFYDKTYGNKKQLIYCFTAVVFLSWLYFGRLFHWMNKAMAKLSVSFSNEEFRVSKFKQAKNRKTKKA